MMNERIKARRKEMGLTQGQLGTLLNKERSTVAKYEAGTVKFANLPMSVIKVLSSTLRIPIGDFLRDA